MLISIILGFATFSVVFAAEKGIDAAVCTKHALRHDPANEFEDEEYANAPQPQQTGPIDPILQKWQGAVKEQLNILRGGEQQTPNITPTETHPPIEVIRTDARDVIDDVFEDIVDDVVEETPNEPVQEAAPVEETVAEEAAPVEKAEETVAAAAPEREPNGRFKGKKKK